MVSAAGRDSIMTSLMICCGFVVCWSPNQILFFLSVLGHDVDLGGSFYHFTTVQLLCKAISPDVKASRSWTDISMKRLRVV